MRLRPSHFLHTAIWAAALIATTPAEPQEYGARQVVERGGKVDFEPRGPGVMFGPMDPTVQRWYVPYELVYEYRWRQAEYSNYARQNYQRYVDTALEGDFFYDTFGNLATRGFLVYDWRQEQPLADGSSVFKGSRLSGWFSNVVVGSDSKAGTSYTVTVGSRIRTMLTPLTFSKAAYDGVQIDFAAERYRATILGSRISNPDPRFTEQAQRQTNATSMFGGRTEVQVGDHIILGGTVVNARNSTTALDLNNGDLVAGNLTLGQSGTPVKAIAVILSDDSPDDRVGGAALFDHDVRIRTRDFETGQEATWTLSDVTEPGANWPDIRGGFDRAGYKTADGEELIVLNYDFTDPGFRFPPETDLDETNIIDIEFDYVVANDFRIAIWSNKQPGTGFGRSGELSGVPSPPLTKAVIDEERPALLTVARADGNITDISNIRRIEFSYGLPTANMVAGLTIEGVDVWGVDFYGEWDRNFRYAQYPNAPLFTANEPHEVLRHTADARYLTASKQEYPFYLFAEAYAIDEDYSTSTFVVDSEGELQYDNPPKHLYEFVDDNDDQDDVPDWLRAGGRATDSIVLPGWDENNDFISDFNQNDNAAVSNEIPDYEEPFLRHNVDHPDFLFGIDLNNNGWIDRFENDDLPDYPYKADRRGANVFGGVYITPELKMTVGRLDESMIASGRQNTTNYAIVAFERDYPGIGVLRVLDMLKHARDNIPDDRRDVPRFGTEGLPSVVNDVLPAQDTWINSTLIGFDYSGAIPYLRVSNKLKYEYYNNAFTPRDRTGRLMDETPTRFGLVNKIDSRFDVGGLSIQPKLKSAYLRRDAFVVEEDDEERWTGLATLIAQFPVLTQSSISLGVELAQETDLAVDEEALFELGRVVETGDVRSVIGALQLANSSEYLGYQLTTHIGFRLARVFTERVQLADRITGRFEKVSDGTTQSTGFITVYAGIQ